MRGAINEHRRSRAFFKMLAGRRSFQVIKSDKTTAVSSLPTVYILGLLVHLLLELIGGLRALPIKKKTQAYWNNKRILKK